jgi:hypothetical protein
MQRLTARLKSGVASLLESSLPGRTKRLILFTSLAARAKETQDLDVTTLRKLNSLMDLAGSEDAMKWPASLSRAIWDGKRSVDAIEMLGKGGPLPEATIRDLVQQIKACIPRCLRYGREGDLDADLEKFVHHKSEVLG